MFGPTTTPERMFSTLKRVKTYLKNTVSEESYYLLVKKKRDFLWQML